METVNFLAQLWGFSLIIVCMALLVQPKNIKNIFKLVETEPTLLLMGMINVILGVVLVLFYSTWDLSWRTVVTVLGWLVILRGCLILFCPDFAKKIVGKFKTNPNWIKIVLVIAVVLGCILVYLGLMAY